MKTARLFAYGISGIIAGLLLENASLRLRQKGGKKLRQIRKDAGKVVDRVVHPA